jgi:predicted transposase YdaD
MQHDQILGKAINIRNEFMKDPDNYAAYLNREMEILDYKSMMKQERSEGRAEGREEGREEGRVEGRAEGRIEERLDNIKNLMINKKFTVEDALSALGIPEENWDSIKSKIK